MFKRIAHWKKVTGKRTWLRALGQVLRTGENALEVDEEVRDLQRRFRIMQEEHLEMAQLVHHYETKLLNLERRAHEAEEKSKQLELAHVAVVRENHWMKEELLDQKKRRRRT